MRAYGLRRFHGYCCRGHHPKEYAGGTRERRAARGEIERVRYEEPAFECLGTCDACLDLKAPPRATCT